MKLYTEEQVKRIITHFYQMDHLLTDRNIEKSIDSVTPIELPSDDEIEKLFPKTNTLYEALGRLGMIEGAKQLRDKIQENNK